MGARRAGVVFVVLTSAWLGGCTCWRHPRPHDMHAAAADRPGAPASGLVTSGPALGKRTIEPSRCIAGGHYQFLGADLVDEERDLVVRVVVDPLQGTVVRVLDAKNPDVATMLLHRAVCEWFVAELEPTGSWVNGVDLVSLHVDLDCRAADGNAIVGSHTAAECQ
jgi:hypothetical protein